MTATKTYRVGNPADYASRTPSSREAMKHGFHYFELNKAAFLAGHSQVVTNGPTRSLEIFYDLGSYWLKYTDSDRVATGRELLNPAIKMVGGPATFQLILKCKCLHEARAKFNCYLGSTLPLWYEIRGDYGQGFECVTTEPSYHMAVATLNTYRENEPGTLFKLHPIFDRHADGQPHEE